MSDDEWTAEDETRWQAMEAERKFMLDVFSREQNFWISEWPTFEEAEAFAIALVQATPGQIAPHDYGERLCDLGEESRGTCDLRRDEDGTWVVVESDPADVADAVARYDFKDASEMVRLGLALIRAAGRTKEER